MQTTKLMKLMSGLALSLTLTSTSFARLVDKDKKAAAPAEPAAPQYVTPGHYRDTSNQIKSDMYIKEITEGKYKNYLAVIVWSSHFISLYRIEVVDASTQAWVSLGQASDNLLTTQADQTATYAVSQVRDGDRLNLHFTWTNYTKELGPKVPCTIIPDFRYEDNDEVWGSFSDLQDASYDGYRPRRDVPSEYRDQLDSSIKLSISNAGNDGSKQRNYNLTASNLINETQDYKEHPLKARDNMIQPPQQYVYNGAFRGTEIIPGLMVARQKDLDSMTESGYALASEISFVALPIRSGRHTTIQLGTIKPGAMDCAYPRSELTP